MDIVEFVETIYEGKLPEWQKKFVLSLYKAIQEGKVSDYKIRVLKDQGKDAFIRMSQSTFKEMTKNGETINSK